MCLGMESGREVLGDTNNPAESSGEDKGELGTSIRYNGIREAMDVKDIVKIQAGHFFR